VSALADNNTVMVFAILIAQVATLGLAQSVGKLVPLVSVTLEPTAKNLPLMEEDLAMLYGAKANAKMITLKVANSMELYGILYVLVDTMLQDAVSALPTVLVV